MDKEQIIKELHDHINENNKVRFSASGHSIVPNAIFNNDNIVSIDMRKYVLPLALNDFDLETCTLKVSAGHTLEYIANYLKSWGMRLYGVPEASGITIGGAISMGAHGGGLTYHSLADYLTDIWFIDGKGRPIHVNDKDICFDIVRISYGTLGPIYQVRIKCFPAYRMKQVNTILPAMPNNFENIIWQKRNTIHSVVFAPYTKRIMITELYPTNDQITYINQLLWKLFYQLTNLPGIIQLIDTIVKIYPQVGRFITESQFNMPSITVFDPYYYMNNITHANAYVISYAVPYTVALDCYNAINVVLRRAESKKQYITFRYWCRFLAQDQAENSLSNKWIAVVFEILFSKILPNANQLFEELALTFIHYKGRPHLGKSALLKPPRDYVKLNKLRAIYDPKNKFVDANMRRFLAND